MRDFLSWVVTITVAICMAAMILVVVNLLLSGCAHDGCDPAAQRCRHGDVQTCNADGDWYVTDHCDQVHPLDWGWTCCPVPEEEGVLACLPAAECDGGVP